MGVCACGDEYSDSDECSSGEDSDSSDDSDCSSDDSDSEGVARSPAVTTPLASSSRSVAAVSSYLLTPALRLCMTSSPGATTKVCLSRCDGDDEKTAATLPKVPAGGSAPVALASATLVHCCWHLRLLGGRAKHYLYRYRSRPKRG